MSRQQKKKQFKKRFGINPPRRPSIRAATQIMERRENIIAVFERLKRAILDLWEMIKKPALELAEALKEAATALISAPERTHKQYVALVDFQTKVLLQQRQQEREVTPIEGSFNTFNHDRR